MLHIYKTINLLLLLLTLGPAGFDLECFKRQAIFSTIREKKNDLKILLPDCLFAIFKETFTFSCI